MHREKLFCDFLFSACEVMQRKPNAFHFSEICERFVRVNTSLCVFAQRKQRVADLLLRAPVLHQESRQGTCAELPPPSNSFSFVERMKVLAMAVGKLSPPDPQVQPIRPRRVCSWRCSTGAPLYRLRLCSTFCSEDPRTARALRYSSLMWTLWAAAHRVANPESDCQKNEST